MVYHIFDNLIVLANYKSRNHILVSVKRGGCLVSVHSLNIDLDDMK